MGYDLPNAELQPWDYRTLEVALVDGEQTYEAMERLVGEARHHVHLLFYTWRPDEIGRRFRDD